MPKEIIPLHSNHASPLDLKIIKLAVSFFALCVALFIVGIFKLETLSVAPFSDSRDYIVFEKSTLVKRVCMPNEICFEHLIVFRSGKAISLGSKMAIKFLSKKDMTHLITAIDTTDIFNKDCAEVASDIQKTYVIKLGSEVKRTSSGLCDDQLNLIESQIFQ